MLITNTYGLPETIVKAVTNTWKPRQFPRRFSVSELLNSPQAQQLYVRHWDDIEEDISERIWVLLGNAVHAILQQGKIENSLAEESLKGIIDDNVVSGRPDLWHNQAITDYKITSVWTIVYAPQGRPDWSAQLNVYKWLYDIAGFETNKLEICAILRDWQESKVDKSYPLIPIVAIKVPVWTRAETEAFLRERIAAHTSARALLDNQQFPCSSIDKWAKPTQYAVMKKGRKSAIRLYDSEGNAKANCPESKENYIEVRPGADVRCERYCQGRPWCEQYKKEHGGLTEVPEGQQGYITDD